MATSLSTPSSVQHNQFETAARKQAVTSPEQASAASEAAILRTMTVMIIGGIVLLGSISVWLWYGMHHYQDCL